MAAQALYRTWRPQTFAELVGQEHVAHTLQNALRSDRIAHAYLFTGPRGTGKTSTARILAKAVNCLAEDVNGRPCNKCSFCQAINEGRLLDLIEIDAASNRGIDEIRALREQVNFMPTEARYKVYVIDEVHMLTNEAFNALLKTLEEPPGHVIFVLATTDPQRVPATVLSRCQRFDFRRIPFRDMVDHLSHIVTEMGRKAESAALDQIAHAATGSLRDAISLLDQLLVSDEKNLTLEQVQNLLGFVSEEVVQRLATHLSNHDVGTGLTLINRLSQEGTDLRQLTRQVVAYLRGLLVLQVGSDSTSLHLPEETMTQMQQQARLWSAEDLVRAIRLFNRAENELRLGFQPQLPLELAFIEAVQSTEEIPSTRKPVRRPQSVAPAKRDEDRATSTTVAPRRPEPAVPPQTASKEPTPAPGATSEEQTPTATGEPLAIIKERWSDILLQLKGGGKNTDSFLRSHSYPLRIEGSVLVIGFKYDFHKERVERPEHRQLIEETISQVVGKELGVRCVLVEGEGPEAPPVNRTAVHSTTEPASPESGEEQTLLPAVARVVEQFAEEHDGIVHDESSEGSPE